MSDWRLPNHSAMMPYLRLGVSGLGVAAVGAVIGALNTLADGPIRTTVVGVVLGAVGIGIGWIAILLGWFRVTVLPALRMLVSLKRLADRGGLTRNDLPSADGQSEAQRSAPQALTGTSGLDPEARTDAPSGLNNRDGIGRPGS